MNTMNTMETGKKACPLAGAFANIEFCTLNVDGNPIIQRWDDAREICLNWWGEDMTTLPASDDPLLWVTVDGQPKTAELVRVTKSSSQPIFFDLLVFIGVEARNAER